MPRLASSVTTTKSSVSTQRTFLPRKLLVIILPCPATPAREGSRRAAVKQKEAVGAGSSSSSCYLGSSLLEVMLDSQRIGASSQDRGFSWSDYVRGAAWSLGVQGCATKYKQLEVKKNVMIRVVSRVDESNKIAFYAQSSVRLLQTPLGIRSAKPHDEISYDFGMIKGLLRSNEGLFSLSFNHYIQVIHYMDPLLLLHTDLNRRLLQPVDEPHTQSRWCD